MIHIDFDPKTLTGDDRVWWTNWEARAQTATKQVLAAWEAWRNDPSDKTFDEFFNKQGHQKVWADLKDWLQSKVFNNKCAYCETPTVRATLHAEHYWPKGMVTSDRKKVRIKDHTGQETDHPGYFWLAFHWTNLVPACEWCNTVNGKRNEFPIPQTTYLSVYKKLTRAECKKLKEKLIKSTVWPNIFYFQPIDLDDKEGRLLLHPYLDNPRKCLKFDDWGKVIEIGDENEQARGRWSIKVYNLNDERIVTARRETQLKALRKYNRETEYFSEDEKLPLKQAKNKAKSLLTDYISSKAPYSAAVLDFLNLEDSANFPLDWINE
jgi:hypothetical protein